MIFQWKAEYNVGVKEIDEQHKKLFRILDDLIMTQKGNAEDDFFFVLNDLS